MAGHPGIEGTIRKIEKKYFWPTMNDDVENFVKSCDVCLRRESQRGPQAGLMNSLETSGPFQIIGIDSIGKLATTKKSNEHILVAIDYFSSWVSLLRTSQFR